MKASSDFNGSKQHAAMAETYMNFNGSNEHVKRRTISKVKLEQYAERTLPYNDLVLKGLGPFDYTTTENPKYQKEIDNQNKFESQEKF